jgi:hypothetical protein
LGEIFTTLSHLDIILLALIPFTITVHSTVGHFIELQVGMQVFLQVFSISLLEIILDALLDTLTVIMVLDSTVLIRDLIETDSLDQIDIMEIVFIPVDFMALIEVLLGIDFRAVIEAMDSIGITGLTEVLTQIGIDRVMVE